MAIAFNIPSEREATEENYSRLNRLLAELYDVLCHILVSRQPSAGAAASVTSAPEERRERPQEQRPRDRPFSDSDLERPGYSGLPDVVIPVPPPRRRPRSANPPHLPPLTDYTDLDDEVFISPRTDNYGNDPFSNPRNMEIFGSPRSGSPRTPAGVLLSPRSRTERRFTFSVTSEKHWRDKGGTDETDAIVRSGSSDETDASTSKMSSSSEGSLLSSILPDKISGSICTAVLFMLGWKLLASKR